MQVFHINLASRQDHNEEFLDRNSQCADCYQIDAIDGDGLPVDALAGGGIVAEPLEAFAPCILASVWRRRIAAPAERFRQPDRLTAVI